MNCERCGGFKLFDYFDGATPCDGFRCINCGSITNVRMITPVRPPARLQAVRRKILPAAPVQPE